MMPITRSRVTPVALSLALAAVMVQQSRAIDATQVPQSPARPRLIVMLVADQFRGDYVPLYGQMWTQGLHEVFTRGAYFPDAAYPYAGTKTCAGHASIGTGRLPASHGLIDNEWYDASAHGFTTCTEDPGARALSYTNVAGTEHHSARWMQGSTLADQLRRTSPRSRVVALSVKPRSVIGLAGHGGPNTTFVWNEEATGTWATSSAFTTNASSVVATFLKNHPLTAARGTAWTRLLPDTAYLGRDDAPGEQMPNVFPHLLDEPVRTTRASATFVDVWEQTPLPDALLGDLAATLVTKLALGQQTQTDFLAVGFSALDSVGHKYGPRSHEVQDVLANLDRVIGTLIAHLDRVVGRDRYVLALSADHGVADNPEQQPAGTAGRVSLSGVAASVENALDRTLGRGDYLEAASGSSLYFRPGVLDRVRANAAATAAVETAIADVRGVARGIWSDALGATTPTSDDLLRLMRASYVAGRSGDLEFIPRPGWIIVGTGTTHGTPYAYDREVPVAFLGAGVATGRFSTHATPLDIAPTLAALGGLALPRTDGRVLTEAVTRR